MAINIRILSSAHPEICGIAEYTHHLVDELQDLTAEIANCSITAIRDKVWEPQPHIPIDTQIARRDPSSWNTGITAILHRSSERHKATGCPTVVLAQHEFAFHENEEGDAGKAETFKTALERLRDASIPTAVCFHTIPKTPSAHFLKTIKDISDICEGVIVLTESAPGILRKQPYDLKSDIVHIPHGIRVQKDTSEEARRAKKREYGYMAGDKELFLVLTAGFKSPGKGIHIGMKACAKFVKEYLSAKERQRTLWLIPGIFHPGFVAYKEGELYRRYAEKLEGIAQETKLRVKTITGEPEERKEKIRNLDMRNIDIIFDEGYQTERAWMDNLVAADCVFAPYDNNEQISSGFIADATGSSRPIIATPFPYAIDMIGQTREGIIGERGFLPERNNPNQMAEALYYAATNAKQRAEMTRRLGLKRAMMDWPSVAIAHANYLTRIAASAEKSTLIELIGKKRNPLAT